MGIVYKAQDTKLDRVVALKFLPQYLSTDAHEKDRFYQEARAASALLNANVAVIFEVNEHNGQLFLAMEYVEGQTLKQLVEEGEPLSIKKVLDIAIQACDGLVAAHEKEIVHRDIKSDNIMITKKGQVKIMDFGLAKLKGATKLTKVGSTIGTAAYMSPEQAQGEEVDARSDIFSFGVVLYELLTSKLPFRGEHQSAMMYSLINEDPQPMARFNDKIPADLERIVLKALAKDKDERYQHADDMLADLRRERKNLEYGRTGYVRATDIPVRENQSRASATSYQPVSGSAEPVMQGNLTKKATIRYAFIGGGIIVLVILAVLFNPFNLQIGTTKAASDAGKSIAVIPFSNLSDSKEDDLFCEGITEDILTELSKISDLRVTSRSSIIRYKGTQKSSKEVGSELGVATLLEGSIRRSGNRIRITGQLIDAATDRQIWADSYDREMKDVFDIQAEVAKGIASALQAKLSPTEEASIEKKPTENVEAYGFYTKGRQDYYLYHKQDNDQAIELFKKALNLDPNYALAYAGLGDSYGQRVIKFGYSEDWLDSAIAMGEKSIALDPNLAEGYKALGLGYGGKGLINKALDVYYKAVEKNPGYTPAVGNIAIENTALGNFAEAYRWAVKDSKLSQAEPFVFEERAQLYMILCDDEKAKQWASKALELQPDFIFSELAYCNIYLEEGDFAQARQHVRKALSIQPDDPSALNLAATVELFAGNYSDALKEFQRALEKGAKVSDFNFRSNSSGLGFSLIKLGKREEGLKVLTDCAASLEGLIRNGDEQSIPPYELGGIAAVHGNKPLALDWLGKAETAGWRRYRFMQLDPMMESLRNDPAFKKIVDDIKSKVEDQAKQVSAMENQ